MTESVPPEVRLFLQPGEVAIVAAPARVKTILGSCVAISMRAPRLGLASMTHCVLPRSASPPGSHPREEALKYVDTAIEWVLRELAGRGIEPQELEVKLFGGADSMASNRNHPYQVGRMNVEAAEESLAARGLALAARSTGGRLGRVIELDCATGDVTVRKLPGSRRFAPGEAI